MPETDAILETVHSINREADADDGTIRLSLDTKAVVPIGRLSRGGKSFTTGTATADFMADRLQAIWPTLQKTIVLRIPS